MKQIHPIRNKKDCDAATREIERFMDKETSKKLTKAEAARLDVLATLVDAYESDLVQDVPPDPIEALKFRLEQLGLPLADLARPWATAAAPATNRAMTSFRRSRIALLGFALVAIGCGSSSSDGSTGGDEASLFEIRYCEVLLADVEGDVAIVDVFNTVGLNECPSELWEALDTDEIAEEQGVFTAVLNGPRFFTVDGAAGGDSATGETEEFGGIDMQKVAEIRLPLAQALELLDRADPYAEFVVDRDNTWVFSAGREVYELINPDGEAYVMQSTSHQVDDTLASVDLPSLGEQLQLPAGWTFRARVVPSELVVQSTDQAIVTQDELRNSYQKY